MTDVRAHRRLWRATLTFTAGKHTQRPREQGICGQTVRPGHRPFLRGDQARPNEPRPVLKPLCRSRWKARMGRSPPGR